MLFGSLQTKEKRILLALLVVILIMAGCFAYLGHITNKRFEEQAVMAEDYLKAGDFEQAVQAYLKALSMKNSKQELLSIGLAEAYIGMHQYDKALEVLRNDYKKTGANTIKEKIEEVTAEKTDYEFNQIASHAETYFTNGEYEKAITEYNKAKLIKSKEAISYQRIAEAYIELGDYNLARNEVLEGLALTQSELLSSTLNKVEKYLLDTQYAELLNVASEYIYQENYEDGILKLKEAIALLPKEEGAYHSLAEVYILLEDYEGAVSLLETALTKRNSAALRELLDKAETLRDERKERERILKELYQAAMDAKTDQILNLMDNTFFTIKIAGAEPVFYSLNGEDKMNNSNGIIVQNKDQIYAGGFQNGLKNGIGIFFMRWQERDTQAFILYEGEWSNDLPNGMGKTVEETISKESDGTSHSLRTVSEGVFISGLEMDTHRRSFYRDGEETGSIQYKALYGVPQPLRNSEGKQISSTVSGSYVIAELQKGGKPTGKYYTVKEDTLWGLTPYITE